MCLTASFLDTDGFKLFQNACIVFYKHAVVTAIRIYAQCGEDAAKKGVRRPFIK